MEDANCEELEKVQLQKAIAALSERLLLLQNVVEERRKVESHLSVSE